MPSSIENPDSQWQLAAASLLEQSRSNQRLKWAAGVEELAATLRDLPASTRYTGLIRPVRERLESLRVEPVDEGEFLVRLLLALMAQFDTARHRHKLPNVALEQYANQFKRIVRQCAGRDKTSTLRLDDDTFNKDLAICLGRLIPACTRVLEIEAGWSRRVAIADGLPGLRKFLAYAWQEGLANAPYYSFHVHPQMLESFNPQGWIQTLEITAELLAANPHMRGAFVGGGWLYDPQLERVSPNLAYIARTGLEAGAYRFYVGIDDSGAPFQRSKSRREKFERGEYIPRAHILIWPREHLIGWARRVHQLESETGRDSAPD